MTLPIRVDLAIGALNVAMKTTTDPEVRPWLQTALDFLEGDYEPMDDDPDQSAAEGCDAAQVEGDGSREANNYGASIPLPTSTLKG